MSTGKKALIFVLILVVVGGLIGFGAYNALKQQNDTGIPRNAIPVQTEVPHRETITSTVTAKGTVELIDRTTVFPQTQARIEEVHVKSGDEVQAGDLLLTYDIETLEGYQDQLADAQLALQTAQLALANEQEPPSRTELLQSETQITQAEKAIEDINANVRSIDLNMEQLNESIENARKTVEDTQALFVLGVATQTECDSANDALKTLEDQLETTALSRETALAGLPIAEESASLARAQYETLQNRLDDPKIQNLIATQEIRVQQAQLLVDQIQQNIDDFEEQEFAPLSGTILSLTAAVGDVASSGRAIAEIAPTTNENLVISINVPEADATNIVEGQQAEIEGDALGETVYMGYVSRIYPLAEMKQLGNSMETVLTVEIKPDEDINLRAGYSIDATIITGVQENALVAPLMSTLSDTDGSYFVYVMRDDYSVEKRSVTLGAYAGVYVETTGVTESDRIILNPTPAIMEGVFVKPLS